MTINYYDGRSEKVESIKLKKSDIELSARIHIEHKGSIMISELIEYGKKIMENNLYRIKEANKMLNQTAVDIYDDIEICQGVKYADTEEALV